MTNELISREYFNAYDLSIEAIIKREVEDEYIEDIVGSTCVYIQYTSDKRKYYVGESNRYLTLDNSKGRLYEHLQEKKTEAGNIIHNKFDRVLIITSRYLKGNGEILETKLLKYIDTEFKLINDRILVNRRLNQSHAEEKSREIEYELFPELWNFLQERKFVKNNLKGIEESGIKYYSPYGKSFDVKQEDIIKRIIDIGKSAGNENRFLIKGEPGTGKTFITALAVLELIRFDKRVAIIINQTSMSKIYTDIFKFVQKSKKPFIGSLATFRNNILNKNIKLEEFSMIIVDEAHRLKQPQGKHNFLPNTFVLDRNNMDLTELDVIERYNKNIVLMYDEYQLIRDSDIDIKKFKERVSNYEEIELQVQYRIKSTSQIPAENYTRGLRRILQLEDTKFDESIFTNGYNFKIVDTLTELVNYITYKTNTGKTNVRLLSGFYKQWTSNGTSLFEWKEAEYGVNLKWNTPNNKLGKSNWLTFTASEKLECEEVGSIHIAQGMDLDYAGVIVGKDLDIKVNAKGEEILVASRENYFDTNGIPINGTDDNNERLTEYIKKVYYVLLTRGIHGTAIYFENPKVQEYFKRSMYKDF